MLITSLNQFLTEGQIREVIDLHENLGDTSSFAKAVAFQIAEPNLEEINRKLGTINSANCVGYLVKKLMGR